MAVATDAEETIGADWGRNFVTTVVSVHGEEVEEGEGEIQQFTGGRFVKAICCGHRQEESGLLAPQLVSLANEVLGQGMLIVWD